MRDNKAVDNDNAAVLGPVKIEHLLYSILKFSHLFLYVNMSSTEEISCLNCNIM
jgi:hypothetical protein